jgi:hypothetical protein
LRGTNLLKKKPFLERKVIIISYYYLKKQITTGTSLLLLLHAAVAPPSPAALRRTAFCGATATTKKNTGHKNIDGKRATVIFLFFVSFPYESATEEVRGIPSDINLSANVNAMGIFLGKGRSFLGKGIVWRKKRYFFGERNCLAKKRYFFGDLVNKCHGL